MAEKSEKHDRDDEMVLFKTVHDDVELALIKNILDEKQIPCHLKDLGISGYIRIIAGFSIYGTEIYVRESDFEKAMEAIGGIEWKE